MCGTKPRKNLVISLFLVKDQVSLLFSLGISATPLYNGMSEADKSKVESGQYSIVYGHRSRGWRHTMARGNAHKLKFSSSLLMKRTLFVTGKFCTSCC